MLQLPGQPSQYLVRGQQPHGGGGEFQGQRQAVEPAAQLGDRGGVLAGQREAGLDIPGPVHEQPHRRGFGEHRQGASGRGNAKRIHPSFLFSA